MSGDPAPVIAKNLPPAPYAMIGAIAALYAWAIFATTFRHPGAIGPDYDTPGTDYMAMHAGIAVALRGDLALLFDAERFTAFINTLYHALLPYPVITRPFVYPPGFLIILLPFAAFPFRLSYVLFQLATAALLAVALCAGRRDRARAGWIALLVLLSPAASVNWLEGQVAFLVAALLVGGTRLLPRHPIWAGVVFGLLSVKPQHALLVPVMLVAMGAWRTILSACATAVCLAASSALLFGPGIWTAWVDAILHYPSIDSVWDNSVHTCAILLGAGKIGAAVAQAAAIGLGAALVFAVSNHRGASVSLRVAILLAATNLASPHTGPYDIILQVIAGALLLTETVPVPPLFWTLGLCVWLLPLLSQPAISPVARFAPLLTLVLLGCLFERVRRQGSHAVVGG